MIVIYFKRIFWILKKRVDVFVIYGFDYLDMFRRSVINKIK